MANVARQYPRTPSDASSDVGDAAVALDTPRARAFGLILDARDDLFRSGDPRAHVYRVDMGTVWLLTGGRGRPLVPFGAALPGDFVGFGPRKHHVYTARAMTQTHVTCIPIERVGALLGSHAELRAQYARGAESEFAARRSLIIASPSSPVRRLAAFLVALSRINKYEGMDPSCIQENIKASYVCECLALDMRALGRALVELKAKGVVDTGANSTLHLKDLEALERLADI
jgi:CRP/FNR family transcriptional regulator